MKLKTCIALFFSALIAFSAQGSKPATDSLKLKFSSPPIDLSGTPARFAGNIPYGPNALNRFDIFLPDDSKKPFPVVFFVHGGGFVQGDKAEIYNDKKRVAEIRMLLKANIAFVTINYRLLLPKDKKGVKKCLNDSKYCLQFIRYHALKLGIDKNSIAGYGFSAGGGTVLWLGCHDDMKDPGNTDPVLCESTRLLAAAARETQCTYDLKRWADDVFSDFSGMNFAKIVQLAGGNKIYPFYGISSLAEFDSPETQAYRADVDMLALMDHLDAPLWVENNNPAAKPSNRTELFHHPFHARELKQHAEAVGLACKAHIPEVPGMDVPAQGLIDFFVEKLK